jgi:hypothetical protein
MQVKQILTILCFDNQLNCGSAPDVFSVIDVNLVSWLDMHKPVAIDPLFVFLHPVLPAFELFWVTLVFFGENNHFYRVVHHKGELQNLSPNIFAARRAILFPYEAL